MRLLTSDDFTDTYAKLVQRGSGFLASKFSIRGSGRTLSAFNNTAGMAANWWMIPKVRQRWNRMITGGESTPYEDYVMVKYLEGRKNLKMLSLGSGTCSHELYFAGYPVFSEISCYDLADNLLEKARKLSLERNLQNISFTRADAHSIDFTEFSFDVILFHASLHHFKDIDHLIGGKLLNALKEDGIVIINEYVGPNRLQFPPVQIRAVNQALKIIPKYYRQRFKLGLSKNKVSGPGILRTLIADPSEARESAMILETMDKYLETVEKKPFGGNIIMLALKDIAHNFMEDTPESCQILQKLFDLEDEYLLKAKSDFVFAVYKKKID